jgi:hypothetical protein
MFKNALTENELRNLEFNPAVIETETEYGTLLQSVELGKATGKFGDMESAAELAHEISNNSTVEEMEDGYVVDFEDGAADRYFEEEVMPAVEQADVDVDPDLVIHDDDNRALIEKAYKFGVGVRSGILDQVDENTTEVNYGDFNLDLSRYDEDDPITIITASEVMNHEYDKRNEDVEQAQAFDYGMTAALLDGIV